MPFTVPVPSFSSPGPSWPPTSIFLLLSPSPPVRPYRSVPGPACSGFLSAASRVTSSLPCFACPPYFSCPLVASGPGRSQRSPPPLAAVDKVGFVSGFPPAAFGLLLPSIFSLVVLALSRRRFRWLTLICLTWWPRCRCTVLCRNR